MKLPSSNIKNFLVFSQKKTFLIFQETLTPEKFIYILGKGNPKKLLTFQEVTFLAQKVTRTHS